MLTALEVYRTIGVLTAADIRRVAAEWRAAHVTKGEPGYDSPLYDEPNPTAAYVNDGRWLIDCDCGSGAMTTAPGPQAIAVCFSCGAVWTTLLFPPPPVRGEIEGLLSARRWRRNQNWKPGETVEDLRRENEAHAGRGLR